MTVVHKFYHVSSVMLRIIVFLTRNTFMRNRASIVFIALLIYRLLVVGSSAPLHLWFVDPTLYML